jgi:hypothetical protein
MGDPARFRLFADVIEREFPDRSAPIADVAGGKGGLKAELYQRGYRCVTCWDVRRRLAKGRPGQRYQRFEVASAPRGYKLVAAMHPDEATDHAILYAAKHRVPCVVCPCCLKPSAVPYNGRQTPDAWNTHLAQLAIARRMRVTMEVLPMAGQNVVLISRPA